MVAIRKVEELKDNYDVVVIGSGLGGLTGANKLARMGYQVLLMEHHFQLGGLATWFKRKGRHIFDVSLHGFPVGMKKTCRKYWSKEIADRIVQLKSVRFDNPQFTLETTFTEEDFTRLFVEKFGLPLETVQSFYNSIREMNFYDDQSLTVGELFENFFPGRSDVLRLLMEPITYANGSTLQEPAITYGIVFSNFMSKGVYTFKGGSDLMIQMMEKELIKNGVDIIRRCKATSIELKEGAVTRVAFERTSGLEKGLKGEVSTRSVLSNASLTGTVNKLVGRDHFSSDFQNRVQEVKVNTSSCQVYMGLKKGAEIPFIGDLLFTSQSPQFSSEELLKPDTTSRTFSIYYPSTRPHLEPTYAIVASSNARYSDWLHLDDVEYEKAKENLIEVTLKGLEKYLPDIREKIDHIEAATPRTIKRYTLHPEGSSFGTKFEGLEASQKLPEEIKGLFHAGSVGIIMSGWLGAANYGVIISNEMDKYLSHSGGV